ncbi:all-trans retinoic acid-induced differentiation factor [Chanos chanos]|uniref:All-trans retinoic acid-induced differentiation factor n=1 Tax=Chanos chanos TaxID=29144 RepID=A0A6J2V8C7_CHACN|nr:all-trans retinoic acid-induced differentiation factor [Chanos chanos]
MENRVTNEVLCQMCQGEVQTGSAVADLCISNLGQLDGRCCKRRDNASDVVDIIGLDLSNCSLRHLEDLHDASMAILIDISLNPLSNLSDSVFLGFYNLANLTLPSNLQCPGSDDAWEKVEVKGDLRFCEGQKSACNQTGQMSWDCPENSLCTPYGPGFFECNCVDNFHGYKCLREGQFPTLKVFGILGGSTVFVSALLWVTQRRKVKAI